MASALARVAPRPRCRGGDPESRGPARRAVYSRLQGPSSAMDKGEPSRAMVLAENAKVPLAPRQGPIRAIEVLIFPAVQFARTSRGRFRCFALGQTISSSAPEAAPPLPAQARDGRGRRRRHVPPRGVALAAGPSVSPTPVRALDTLLVARGGGGGSGRDKTRYWSIGCGPAGPTPGRVRRRLSLHRRIPCLPPQACWTGRSRGHSLEGLAPGWLSAFPPCVSRADPDFCV